MEWKFRFSVGNVFLRLVNSLSHAENSIWRPESDLSEGIRHASHTRTRTRRKKSRSRAFGEQLVRLATGPPGRGGGENDSSEVSRSVFPRPISHALTARLLTCSWGPQKGGENEIICFH